MSMKPVHVICGKCGSDEVVIKFDIKGLTKTDIEDCGYPIYFSCPNCGEITCYLEFNERQANSK